MGACQRFPVRGDSFIREGFPEQRKHVCGRKFCLVDWREYEKIMVGRRILSKGLLSMPYACGVSVDRSRRRGKGV